MATKKKTETPNSNVLEAQVKSLSADVASLSLSVANIERQLAELTTVDAASFTPPVPEGLEARFNKLIETLSSKFGGIQGI